MDERRARIHDDLRGLISGDLLFHPLERAPYAHDASIYEIDPLGAVAPRTAEDLVAVVRYASDGGIPLHARGAGTGLAGGALGPGLVIDFSRHFRRIVEIGPEHVVVQAGVVLDVLNAQLAPIGRKIGPDPSVPEARTIGGMIGVDSAGSRSLKYGTTADHVEALSVVFANGEVGGLAPQPWPAIDDEPTDFRGAVTRKVASLARFHADRLSRFQPHRSRDRAGYRLDAAARPEALDLSRLVVGSEGTLALVAEARLRTVPIPTAQAVVLLPFSRIAEAAAAVTDAIAEGSPSACDLFDWRGLSLARDASPFYRSRIAESAGAALLIEFEGDDPSDVAGRARRLVARIGRSPGLVSDPVEALRRADCESLMGLRRVITPLLLRMAGPERPVPFLEDVAVPPESIAAFVHRFQAIMRRHEASWTLYGHAGDGQLHARPFLDLSDPRDVAKIEPMADDVAEAAWDLGGTVSGEHGCGLVRTQFLRRQRVDLARADAEIKEAFDPGGILNPGKVVGDDPHLMTRNLRRLAPRTPEGAERASESGEGPAIAAQAAIDIEVLPVAALRWPPEAGMIAVANDCNGCGACRSREPTMRMCPTFRANRLEAATPRSKANLIRQVAAGSIDPKSWGTEAFKQNADLCVHCNLCRVECPAGVDVSTLMLEAKAAFVENHGLPQGDWFLSRVDVWSSMASRFPILGNALLKNGTARWLLERFTGLSRHRRLPKAHRTPFVRRAERLGLARVRSQEPGPRVAYFVDVYANHFDQELAEAVVAVLQRAGINVLVPKGQRGSGMPALVAGDLDHARHLAAANLRVLGDIVREGYTIVCSEPTAALMLRREYLKLTDDLDAALVAENTRDVGDYLAGLWGRGQMPAADHPIRAKVGYHQPCHLRALEVGTPGMDLIRTIPELEVEFIDRGCSGIAGTFGLARKNFRTSLRAGRGLLGRLRGDDLDIGATECGTCRMQMEQGVAKRTLHPIKLLAMGYGLNPALRRRFREPKPRHVVS